MVKTPRCHCRWGLGVGSIPDWGIKIPRAAQSSQKKKKSEEH